MVFPDGLPSGVRYCVWQLEKGEQGTTHIQGYIAFTEAKSNSAVRKIVCKTADGIPFKPFEHAALFYAKGTGPQNKAYCTKAETRVDGPWELGSCPLQGSRVDLTDPLNDRVKEKKRQSEHLDEAIAKLKATHANFSLIDDATFVRFHAGLTKLVTKMRAPWRKNLKVITIVGTTGIGKSFALHTLYPDISLCQWGNCGAWFPDYVGQSVLAFEEFRGQIPLQAILKYTDFYGVPLEQKGGSVPCAATVIFITSNTEPEYWYKNDPMHPRDGEMDALYRRLDYVPTGKEAQYGKVSGLRYIKASTREELHRKLRLALSIEDLDPKPMDWSVIGGEHPLGAAAAVDVDLLEPPEKRHKPDEDSLAIDARTTSPDPAFYAPSP